MAYASNEKRRAYERGRVRSEEEKAYQREWMRKRRLCPEVRKQESKRQREWQKKNWETHGFYNDSRSAKKRGYEWELDLETYRLLRLGNCVYCAAGADPLNGIDRVDNARGYTKDNCASACFLCNRAKSIQPVEEFIAWVFRAADNLRK